jgi:hypothetical protein
MWSRHQKCLRTSCGKGSETEEIKPAKDTGTEEPEAGKGSETEEIELRKDAGIDDRESLDDLAIDVGIEDVELGEPLDPDE